MFISAQYKNYSNEFDTGIYLPEVDHYYGLTDQVIDNVLIISHEAWVDTTFTDLGKAIYSGLTPTEAVIKIVDKPSRVQRLLKYRPDLIEPVLKELGCDAKTPKAIFNFLRKLSGYGEYSYHGMTTKVSANAPLTTALTNKNGDVVAPNMKTALAEIIRQCL